MTTLHRALALLTLLALPLPMAAAANPTPRPTPVVHLPNEKLHTEFLVEVNKMGQVVRVKSGKSCKNLTFNAQTYGNVLQMFIRHPDGTAEVGLYRVTFDYNPATRKVARQVALQKAGGTWGDEEGAANQMMDIAKRQADEARAKAQQQQQAQNAKLPSLNQITKPTPKPTKHP